jgi:hypothetical protein
MYDNKEDQDNRIKLYNILVEQLQKYNTVIWQIPTALVAANFLAIDKFLSRPFLLFAISIFDAALIYVFQRMLVQQRAIISATQQSEKELREDFRPFIPDFPKKKINAPTIFLATLWILNAALFAYSVVCICDQLHSRSHL